MKTDIRLAVIGDPVAHSLSPPMHQAALRRCHLQGSYDARHVKPEELASTVKQLREQGMTGFNVTVPHKESILSFLDGIDPDCKRIGAVNTVVNEPDGFVGHNTDASGFGRLLEALHPKGNGQAVLLGAGGAARACVHTLLDHGWDVVVANRTRERAFAAFDGIASIIPLSRKELAAALDTSTLLVQASSAGMNKPAESPLPPGLVLDDRLTVIELVYAPLETRLLKQARRAGCRLVDGLEVLAAQATDAFYLWTGQRLPDEFFRQAAEDAICSSGDGAIGPAPEAKAHRDTIEEMDSVAP